MRRSWCTLSAATLLIALVGLPAPVLAAADGAPGHVPSSALGRNGTLTAYHPPATPSGASSAWTTHRVTLVTGDVVTATAKPGGGYLTSVRPGPGRSWIRFFTVTHRGQVSVIPSDVEYLIQAGRLDPRFFDISMLIAMGYDDLRSPYLGLIAQRAAAARPVMLASARRTRYLPSVHADVLALPRAEAARAWRGLAAAAGRPGRAGHGAVLLAGGISRLWLDARLSVPVTTPAGRPVVVPVRPAAAPRGRVRAAGTPGTIPAPPSTMPLIGVPAARAAGLTGKGVTVAVLDTGYDQAQPDLAGVVSASQNFTTDPGVQDLYGHGTAVSSIIAGSGAASRGRYQGVAPAARIAMGKVCDKTGSCLESAVIAGIDWAVNTVHAPIISMSLGGPDPLLYYLPPDPLAQAVAGDCGKALFVIAAGNSGGVSDVPSRSVESPGIVGCAVTVGAVDDNLALAPFSSTGPVYGTARVKPDVTAPGVGVAAALAAGSVFAQYPQYFPPVYNSYYVELSGTSLSTPHVSGAAALLLQQHPHWTIARLRGALTGTATPNPALGPYQQGTGLISLARAVAQPVASTAATANFALPYPHPAQQAATRTLAYANTGTSTLLLTPSLTLTGPGGVTAPAGLVTATPTPGQGGALLLAPGGTGTLAVTAHGAAAPAGDYTGLLTLTSSDGQVVLRDPVSVAIRPPLRDVTVTVTDVFGHPVGPGTFCTDPSDLASCESGFGAFYHDGLETGTPTWDLATGVVHVKLPPGDYEFAGGIDYGDPSQPAFTDSFFAGIHVRSSGVTATVNDTTAVDPTNRVDDPAASYASTMLGVGSTTGGGWSLSTFAFPGGDQVIPEPDPGSGVDYFSMTSATQGGSPTPARYSIVNYLPGNGVPAGLGTTVSVASMARLHDTYQIAGRPAGDPQGGLPLGAYLYHTLWATLPYASVYGNFNCCFQPATIDDYVSADPHLTWYSQLATLYSQGRAYHTEISRDGVLQSGQVVGETWNQPVLGPVSPSCTRLAGSTYLQCGGVQPFTSFSPAQHTATDTAATGTATLTDKYGNQLASASLQDGAALSMPPAAVPMQPGRYTLAETAALPAIPSRLSTAVNTTWTFTSQPDSTIWLLTPRIDPAGLDANGGAPTGSTTPVTAYFQKAATLGGAPVTLTGATIEVSFDDGTTWQRLPATLGGSSGNPYHAPSAATTITNPATPGFASLRLTGTDSTGGTVTLTIIRAYQIVAPGQ